MSTISRPRTVGALAAWASAVSIAASATGVAEARTEPSGAISQARLNLPFAFEPNVGQADPEVRFLWRRGPTTFLLLPAEVRAIPSGVRLRLFGGSAHARPDALDPLPGRSNYFVGADPRRWRTDVRQFGRVAFRGVYPGIDVVYYVAGGALECDFEVSPGADASAIQLQFEGAGALRIGAGRDLLARSPAGEVLMRVPVVYQVGPSGRRSVEAGYVLRGPGRVGIEIGNYDTSQTLVVDPIFAYSTYLGGTSTEYGRAIAADAAGNVYVTGETLSTNFPVIGPYQGTNAGGYDAFVTKFNPSGTPVYSTYIGGTSTDAAWGIAVDASGYASVTGRTISTDFPTTNPFQGANNGGYDAFVTRLNPAGNALSFSTYLGGATTEYGLAVAVDGSGNVCVTGQTSSTTDFPTLNAFQPVAGGSGYDAFVSKFAPAGTLIFSTYLGGNSTDYGNGIAADGAGNVYVAGQTLSSTLITVNAYQQLNAGGTDAFLTVYNPSGSALLYSTYLGGTGTDYAQSVAVDSSGSAYVVGRTSATFPNVNAVQTAPGGGYDAFLTKFAPSGTSLVYSTYIGGTGTDYGFGCAVSAAGEAYVSGYTSSSTSFPIVNPLQAFGGSTYDSFATMLNAAGSAYVYSSFLGGSSTDYGYAVAADGAGGANYTGYTVSTNFPMSNAYQGTAPGSSNAWVSRVVIPPPGTPTGTRTSTMTRSGTFTRTATVTRSVTATAPPSATASPSGSRTPSGSFTPTSLWSATASATPTASATVPAGSTSTVVASATDTPASSPTDTAVASSTDSATATASASETATASGTAAGSPPAQTATGTETAVAPPSATAATGPAASPSVTPASAVSLYPNPASVERDAAVFFVGLPPGSKVRLYSLAAEFVAQLDVPQGGVVAWNLRNASGKPVAAGVFRYLVRDGGNTRRGILAVLP